MTDKNCPECGGKLVRIVYGLPGPETFEKAERKELFLGGCMPRKFAYYCYSCETSFTQDLSVSDRPEESE